VENFGDIFIIIDAPRLEIFFAQKLLEQWVETRGILIHILPRLKKMKTQPETG
jgi:hypothetical protein